MARPFLGGMIFSLLAINQTGKDYRAEITVLWEVPYKFVRLKKSVIPGTSPLLTYDKRSSAKAFLLPVGSFPVLEEGNKQK
ncbi:hypothetical protein [Kiloniella sp. b19]|uniref:hypothetical protein n=1 Tax=Kiloniella sp. GXU_MW_B19 TaxID=3141326 RepID=UPI0031DDEB52